jgi:molecular chaperone GrpE (heat shock protein)
MNDFHHIYNEIRDNLIDVKNIEKRLNRSDSALRKYNDEVYASHRHHKEELEILRVDFKTMMQDLMASFNNDKIAQNEKSEIVEKELGNIFRGSCDLWEYLYANGASSDIEEEVESYKQIRKQLLAKLSLTELSPEKNDLMNPAEHQNVPVPEGENLDTGREQENLILQVVKPGLRSQSKVLKKAEVILSTLSTPIEATPLKDDLSSPDPEDGNS